MNSGEIFLVIVLAVEVALIGYIFVNVGLMCVKLYRGWKENRLLDKLLSTPEGKKRYEEAVLTAFKEGRSIVISVKDIK